MSNRDVRYATNWLSVALAHDLPALRHLTGCPLGRLWDRWRASVAAITNRLGADPDAAYPDAVPFWNNHARDLARSVEEQLSGATARNANVDHDDGLVAYRVTSRDPHDSSHVVTLHRARDFVAAKEAAARVLGYKPEIVHVDAQYQAGAWSRV